METPRFDYDAVIVGSGFGGSVMAYRLAAAGLRVEVDERQEKIGYKIREAQLQKIPYMLVVGDREAAESTVGVRSRRDGDIGAQRIDEFVDAVQREIAAKSAVSPQLSAQS